MYSEDIAIRASNLGKCYEIYSNPRNRLKQFIFPKLQHLLQLQPRQYFHPFWALKDLSLSIRCGETVGIIGRNGSGKSTLLQIICGTLYPSHGEVHTRGRIAALLELGSGFNPEFTGRENIYLNATVLGLSTEEINARLAEMIAFADIGEFIDQPVKTYSSGMLVRLAFSVIAHVDADILIIDEALAVGDAFFTQKCMRFLRGFMENGTILFVSHDTGSIKNLCNRAIWIDQGHMVQQGLPKEVCESYLQAYYEEQQGASKSSAHKLPGTVRHGNHYKTQRPIQDQDDGLSNILKISAFNPDASSFGKGGAVIEYVYLLDENQNSLPWIVGGEKVIIRISFHAIQDIDSPIVGFAIKDRLGQILFGENTFQSYRQKPLHCPAGKSFQADFTFHMPTLPAGQYSITTAVASGTQAEHEQHHWIHDAIFFTSESSSVSSGLVGIPMLSIALSDAQTEA